MNNFLKNWSYIFSILLNKKILKKPNFSEKGIMLKAKNMVEINKRKKKINALRDVQFSAFSQYGEDGIINWLINKIPNIPKIFVEIGTQDYWESNTRFLLKNDNWKGYLIEASKKDILKIKSQQVYWQHDIKAIQAFVSKENINPLIRQNVKTEHIGLLSIDIDGNDYWILKEINSLSPVIVVCEFNSIFGNIEQLTIPYEPKFQRHEKHYSNLYFGCSINALIHMMTKKNYTFIGTGSLGVNAFFIKNEFKTLIVSDINNIEFNPSFCKEARNFKGQLTHSDINKNLSDIKDLEIFDISLNKINFLKNYQNLFDEDWKKILEIKLS